jgi:hypothetical protein
MSHHNVKHLLQDTIELHRAIRNQRRGMLTYGAVLLQYNSRPHIAVRTRALLEHLKSNIYDHPPYSLDLLPSEYHLFTHLRTGSGHNASKVMSWWKV